MIDILKKYKTRDGREVRIYATDGEVPNSVHGAVSTDNGWQARIWRGDGQIFFGGSEHELDLIEVRPRILREVWVNVYPEHVSPGHDSKKGADAWASNRRIACVKVTIDCEEGEGL